MSIESHVTALLIRLVIMLTTEPSWLSQRKASYMSILTHVHVYVSLSSIPVLLMVTRQWKAQVMRERERRGWRGWGREGRERMGKVVTVTALLVTAASLVSTLLALTMVSYMYVLLYCVQYIYCMSSIEFFLTCTCR